jgi:hypothetical protein
MHWESTGGQLQMSSSQLAGVALPDVRVHCGAPSGMETVADGRYPFGLINSFYEAAFVKAPVNGHSPSARRLSPLESVVCRPAGGFVGTLGHDALERPSIRGGGCTADHPILCSPAGDCEALWRAAPSGTRFAVRTQSCLRTARTNLCVGSRAIALRLQYRSLRQRTGLEIAPQFHQ